MIECAFYFILYFKVLLLMGIFDDLEIEGVPTLFCKVRLGQVRGSDLFPIPTCFKFEIL